MSSTPKKRAAVTQASAETKRKQTPTKESNNSTKDSQIVQLPEAKPTKVISSTKTTKDSLIMPKSSSIKPSSTHKASNQALDDDLFDEEPPKPTKTKTASSKETIKPSPTPVKTIKSKTAKQEIGETLVPAPEIKAKKSSSEKIEKPAPSVEVATKKSLKSKSNDNSPYFISPPAPAPVEEVAATKKANKMKVSQPAPPPKPIIIPQFKPQIKKEKSQVAPEHKRTSKVLNIITPQQKVPSANTANSNLVQKQQEEIKHARTLAFNEPALYPVHIRPLLQHCIFETISSEKQMQIIGSMNALTQIYSQHLTTGIVLLEASGAAKKNQNSAVIEIEQKKTKQLQAYLNFLYQVLRADHIEYAVYQEAAWKCIFEISKVIGTKSFSRLSIDSDSNPLMIALLSYFGCQYLRETTITAFYNQFMAPLDDVRYIMYNLFNQIVQNTAGKRLSTDTHWTSQYKEWSPAVLRSNIISLLSIVRFNTVTTRRLVSSHQVGDNAADFQSKQKNILSNLWLLILKSITIKPTTVDSAFDPQTKREFYDDVSIYTRIYAVLDTLLLPNLPEPLLLADFLSSSFSIGGLIGIQALSGLFILITKHKLEYPKFFTQLYNMCTLDTLYSPHSLTFFKLLNLVLQGNYIPLYFVISFLKKLSRFTLYGPSTATIYITALVFNIMRKHPMVAYLLNRKTSIVKGIAKNAQMQGDLAAEQAATFVSEQDPVAPSPTQATTSTTSKSSKLSKKQPESTPSTPKPTMNDDEPQNLFAMLGKPTHQKKSSTSSKFLQTLTLSTTPTATKGSKDGESEENFKLGAATWTNGQDPFLVDIFGRLAILPEKSRCSDSSLIELKDLTQHYHHLVRQNAKSLFDDNASKFQQDISHLLLYLSYHVVIQQGLTYRSKNLIPTSFQKPLGLLGKAERIITAEERFDDDMKILGSKLDAERNALESIFMW